MSTVMVTNMPIFAEKIGVPRTLAVEFPFGHMLGQPHNRDMQMRIIEQALTLLEEAEQPGSTLHSQEQWPTSFEEALQASHPDTPPPVMNDLVRHIGKILRSTRRRRIGDQ